MSKLFRPALDGTAISCIKDSGFRFFIGSFHSRFVCLHPFLCPPGNFVVVVDASEKAQSHWLQIILVGFLFKVFSSCGFSSIRFRLLVKYSNGCLSCRAAAYKEGNFLLLELFLEFFQKVFRFACPLVDLDSAAHDDEVVVGYFFDFFFFGVYESGFYAFLAECLCDFFGCAGCGTIAGSINNQCLIQRSNPGSFMLVRVGKVFDKE